MTSVQARSTVQNALLALLLEVSSTPKPGNVDRSREYEDLRFEQFLAGAVGTYDGFEMAMNGESLGAAFETAIAGMCQQKGGNTQFGATLLLIPLVVTIAQCDNLNQDTASITVEETTVSDAVHFYRAFERVDVAVPEPPADMEPLDVRRGSDAEPVLRERSVTLHDVMEKSSKRDGIAAEWTNGFRRTFETAQRIEDKSGPITDRAADVYLQLLAEELDTFVITQHDSETAREVMNRANAVIEDGEPIEEFATDLVEREINPGTTADIIAGGLFVALERGLEV